ncbi:AzlD domain-containing protein [Thalassotalea eurytherma]|uniref:Branched-chain amino acid ABC transporter n=1 Tax=Thalassotalea eurytherma TaxID=1144278 RepID=A0ABQ6H3B9_9GAMM|nr:AzlD domain-containing protein [Thalassotalea eurytherma]GLX82009.1 branched-chain amino acid ABC transporter [Thalassotalea eurytherma]
MNEWLLIFGMMAVTFSLRYVFFAFANKISLPEGVKRGLNYVPIAVLSAIIAPAVLMPKGELWLDINNPYIPAALVAILVSWWRRNMLLTVVAGLATFALARYLIN